MCDKMKKNKKKEDKHYQELLKLRKLGTDIVAFRKKRTFHFKKYKEFEKELKVKEKTLIYHLTNIEETKK